MPKPKIAILKKVVLNEKGHYRYYSTKYTRGDKVKPKSEMFNLNNFSEMRPDGTIYPILNIRTEMQLVRFIFNRYGAGEYRIVGYQKGRCGSWTFWRGVIDEEGWTFFEKNSDMREINKARKDLKEAEESGDADMKQQAIEDLQFMKEQSKEESKDVKYGFYPHIRRSGRRGEFHSWDTQDEGLIERTVAEDPYA